MTKELINEARRLEGDYSNNHEVMSHMSVLADALEAATRVPVQGEPNDDLEAMLRRIESFDYDSDRVSDDLEQDIRALVDISRATVPDAATELRAERDAAVAAIERVRAIHERDMVLRDYCSECSDFGSDQFPPGQTVEWPCPTVAALDGAPEPEEKP